MRKRLFVTILLLVAHCPIVMARGTDCENRCAVLYAEQLNLCSKMYGDGAENPNPEMLSKCYATIQRNYYNCMYNCIDEGE